MPESNSARNGSWAAALLFSSTVFTFVFLQRPWFFPGGYLVIPIFALSSFALCIFCAKSLITSSRAAPHLLYALLCTAVVLSYSQSSTHASENSIALFLTTYTALHLHISCNTAISDRDSLRVGNLYVSLMVLTSFGCIIQSALQLSGITIVNQPNNDILAYLIPSDYLTRDYNTYAQHGNYIRSNLFMLEPSITSQAIAMAMVVEMENRKRGNVLLALLLGFTLTLSGSGFLVFCAYAIARTPWPTLVSSLTHTTITRGLIASAIALCIFVPLLYLVNERKYEMSSSNSSFSLRYTLPYSHTADRIGEIGFWGLGAGASERRFASEHGYRINFPHALKTLIEYGPIAAVFLITYLLLSLRVARSKIIAFCGLTTFTLGGGYLLVPQMVMLFGLSCIFGSSTKDALHGEQ